MQDPDMTLLSSSLTEIARTLPAGPGDPAGDAAWSAARDALAWYGVGAQDDPELHAAVESRDADALRAILSQWASDKRLLLERDRDVLKRALKAYRKSLKITVLDAESSVAGGPMSAGRRSGIVGIVPPARYPRAVWDELVRQKRLVDRGHGTYELAPGV